MKEIYFSYDPECNGFETFKTKAEAKTSAQEALNYERGEAHDGWSDSVTNICWGVMIGIVTEVVGSQRKATKEECHLDYIVDYELSPVKIA